MKKLFVAFALVVGLGVSAQTRPAQPKGLTESTPKSSVDQRVEKNVTELSNFITLTPNQKSDMKGLFVTKYKMLTENGDLSTERKEYIASIIENKMAATFDAETMSKLRANKELLYRLTHE